MAGNGVEMLPLLVGAPAEAVPAPREAAAPAAPSPVSRPGMIEPEPAPVAAKPAPKPPEPDLPHVAPGMVPREADYGDTDEAEPAMTVTDPEPAPEPAPARSDAAHKPQMALQGDVLPVRPDVEPLDDAPAMGGKR
jgi:HemY protein